MSTELAETTRRIPAIAVKATRAGLDEHIEEGTSVSVVAKHTAGLEVRDEHGGEEGEERGGSSNRLRCTTRLDNPDFFAPSGHLRGAAAEVG